MNSYQKAALTPILTKSLNESPNKPFYPNLLPVTRYRGSTISNTHYFLRGAQLLSLVTPSFILSFLAWMYCIMIYYYKLFPALPFYLSKSLCLSCFLLFFFRLPFICMSQLVSDLWIHHLLFFLSNCTVLLCRTQHPQRFLQKGWSFRLKYDATSGKLILFEVCLKKSLSNHRVKIKENTKSITEFFGPCCITQINWSTQDTLLC